MDTIGKFNSVAEFAAALDNEPRACWKGTSECVSEWSESRQKSWCGATLPESVNFLENGDAEAAAKIVENFDPNQFKAVVDFARYANGGRDIKTNLPVE